MSATPYRPPTFAVHPGRVRSSTDGDTHYIDGPRLARLYGLEPGSYVVWSSRDDLLRRWDDYRHLFPRTNGDYRL